MNKNLKRTFIIMTVLVLVSGTLLHFVYDWTGKNSIAGLFSAINESTWEHLKLAFFPMLLFGFIFKSFIKPFSNNFIEGLTIGILSTMIFIIAFFYGYQFFLGTNIDFLNILDFILGVIVGEYVFYRIIKKDNFSNYYTKVTSIFILLFITYLFIVFTYYPPNTKLFISPV